MDYKKFNIKYFLNNLLKRQIRISLLHNSLNNFVPEDLYL